jgi:hypothetical protein
MNHRPFLSRFAAACVLVLALIGPSALSRAFSSGPPSGFTNAPGEGNCTACHASFALNSGTAGFQISAPAAIVPGSGHSVTVSFQNSTTPRHGFQVSARDGAGNPSGAWEGVQKGMTQDAGNGFHHEHTYDGTYQSSWTMNWLPPAALPNGPVTLYAAGVEGNDAAGMNGDYVYTAARKIYQAVLTTSGPVWSMNAGHAVTLSAPNHPGELYWIVPSEDPTPFPLGGPFDLEVNPMTGLFNLALQLPQIFQGIHGSLDASGHATAIVTVPYYPPLNGFNLHFAAVTAVPGPLPTEVSNRISVTLQ